MSAWPLTLFPDDRERGCASHGCGVRATSPGPDAWTPVYWAATIDGTGCLSSHPYKRHATAKTPAPSEEVESMNNQLFSWRSITRLALFLLPATLTASAQTAALDHPSTDAEKIADALRAGHASSRRMRGS